MHNLVQSFFRFTIICSFIKTTTNKSIYCYCARVNELCISNPARNIVVLYCYYYYYCKLNTLCMQLWLCSALWDFNYGTPLSPIHSEFFHLITWFAFGAAVVTLSSDQVTCQHHESTHQVAAHHTPQLLSPLRPLHFESLLTAAQQYCA